MAKTAEDFKYDIEMLMAEINDANDQLRKFSAKVSAHKSQLKAAFLKKYAKLNCRDIISIKYRNPLSNGEILEVVGIDVGYNHLHNTDIVYTCTVVDYKKDGTRKLVEKTTIIHQSSLDLSTYTILNDKK